MIAYAIEMFDPPNETDDSIWDRYYNFYQKVFKELYPDDPLTPKERIIKTLKDSHPHYHMYYWLIYNDSREIIGRGESYISKNTHPAFKTNSHIAESRITVLSKFQRKGIGSSLLQKLIKNAVKHKRAIIQSGSSQESGHQFCKKFGGKVAIQESENRLQVVDVDWSMISDWIAEGPKRAQKVSLEMFNDIPDEDIDEYCEIYTETLNQQPWGEIEGREKIIPESRRISEERLKKRGCIWTTLISRENDNKISGLTEILYFPDKPSILYQDLTGVKKEHRGRGLGKWLKAEILRWIHAEYPLVKTIVTGNATTNASMLSINNRIGFKEYKSTTVYKFQTEELVNHFTKAHIAT